MNTFDREREADRIDEQMQRAGGAPDERPARVLVCGSRTWVRADLIERHLAGHPRGTTFIHGAARGADRLAGLIAARLGYEVMEYPADWRGKGKAAGVVRNLQMLDTAPTKVIAFWKDGSTGTGHTVGEARRRGIPVEIVHE